MIPTIWSFLIKEYLKVFFLCLFSFIALLVTTQLHEIATIASFGAGSFHILLFTLYQVLYISPIAIPLSALISAMILLNRLSDSHELSALRSCGFSFTSLLSPLLFTALFLSLCNFTIVSEVATSSHLASRKMVYELTSKNPLVLLQNAKIASLKGAYVQFSPQHSGKQAKNLIVAWANEANQEMNMAIVKKITMKDLHLLGKNITLISSRLSEEEGYLMVENQEEAKMEAYDCARFLYDRGWKMANDHLRYNLLCIRLKALKETCKKEKNDTNIKNLNKCYSEFCRRFSLGVAPLSFTYLGAVFGMRRGRKISRKKIVAVSLVASLTLILFFIAKEFHHHLLLSATCFLVPHAIILFLSSFILHKHATGKE